MPELRDLTVDEISLVDKPSNQGARVAFFKRDKEKTKMKFADVLKSAGTRDQIVAVVEAQAVKISKREGISVAAAYSQAWTNEAHEAYEGAPVGVAKRRERKTYAATKSEAELDRRARKRMEKTGVSYHKACSMELEADPSLYEKYLKEKAAGDTFGEVPEPVEYSEPAFHAGDSRMLNKRKAKSSDDDDDYDEDDDDMPIDKCATCKSEIDKGDKFCSHCGADLAKSRTARTRV